MLKTIMVLIKIPRKQTDEKMKNSKKSTSNIVVTLKDATTKIYEVKTQYRTNGKIKQNVIYLPQCMMGKKVKISIVK